VSVSSTRWHRRSSGERGRSISFFGFRVVVQSDDVRSVHGECGGERLLSATAEMPQHGERYQVTRSRAKRRQHRLGPQPASGARGDQAAHPNGAAPS
jgi:hypothetical protein